VTGGSAEISEATNPITGFTMPDEDVQLQAVFAQKTVALSVADPNFEAVQIDYAQPEAAALRITNTGNIDATVTKVEADGADFVIAQVSDTELTGGSTVKADGGINTSWTIRPKAGLAVGDHTTTVTVTYHAFGETNVSEDALQKATVSVVFTVTEKAPPILQSIITPPDLKVANGTAWDAITLPTTVGINATKETSTADVKWNAGDIAAAKNSYNQNEVENDQTFEISGTITVPDGIVNTNNIPLSVTIKVIVLGKQRAEAPEASLAQSSTAYTEAQSLSISSDTENAPIYYTIKTSTGTDAASMPDDPVAGSGDTKLYSEPLTITGVEGQRVYVIIKAIAQSPDASVYRDSEIQTFIYRFEIPQKYTITVAAEGSGGTATAKIGDGEPAALVRALPGTEVTLTAAAATGYSFESWLASGSDGESSPIITESNKTNATVRVRIPRDDVSVKATFKKLVVELDVKAPVFAEQMVGYSQQPAASVITITNNGNTDAELTGVTVSDAVYTAENGATETVPVFTIGGSGQWVSRKGGSITSWTIQPKTGLAVGTYRAVITVTYKDIDDPAKTQTKTGDVIFSVVKPKLLTIGTPEAVTDLPYGTALADITLPEQVAVTTEDASVTTAPVTWNLTDLDGTYTQYGLEEQTFKINGTIELPDTIDTTGKSLKVQIGVTVDGAPKAEAPTASLASGTSYTENQKVTLTSATQDADIYYTITTDGTVPPNPAKNDTTGKSKKYDGFAALEGTPGVPVTVTVKAIAVKEHMRSSDVSTFVYVIDLPPVYTVTVQSGEGGTATAAAGEETPAGAATARAGVRVTLEAVPDSKHLFKKWEVTSGSGIVIEDETSAQITVAMPESDVTIRAVFEPKTIVPAMDVPSFGWVQGAYEQPEAGVITIRNTGNTNALVKVSIDSSAFVLGKDAAAGGSALPSDQDTVPAGGANASWSLRPKAGLAADEYKTTVTVTYTDIEGAEQTLTKDVLFTVYDASVSILLGITAPSDLTDFENGTELADVKAAIPATVSINATGEENSADVSWDLAELEANYHVDTLTEQSFVIRGTAALPTGMINPDNHSLNVELRLAVKAAPQAEAPFATLQADRIYTENQTVSISSNTPDAEIYYTMTTDGSEPETPLKDGADSVRYQGLIPVNGIHGQSVKTIIKAVAVPPQGVRMRDSDVVTFVYTISLPPLYEMTITKDGSGTIEAEAPDAEEMRKNADSSFTVKAIAGTAVTLRAEPARLYLFKGWSMSGAAEGTIADAVSTNTTALMPEGNVTVKAVFEKQRIALDVKPPAFAGVQEEYAQPDAKTITITNNGNVDAYISEISLDGADFVMAKIGAQEVPNTVSENGGVNLPADTTVLKVQKTIAAGGSLALWTLQPKAGLGIGEHKATVTVTYTDVDGESRTQTAQALFSVSDKTFTITFDANGGSGSMKALTVKKGERVTLPANGFTAPSGKAFREWAIGSAGGTAVKAGDTYTFTENTTLYAVWEDSYTATKKEQASNALKLNAGLKASTKGSKISVSWGKVKTADGYQIYAAYCGKKFNTKTPAKTVRKGSTTSVSISKIGGKKLNTKKQCKLYVVAYKLVNGKKVPIGQSITAYVAGSANKTYTNVKKVTVKKSKITLKVKKTYKLQPKATLVNPSKKKLPASYGKEFRYASSDKSVATVTAAGKIKAVGKGKCTIYVYARNGYAKKVTVTVK
ncbi:MAG: chitobiase/beta-hexosaminidase C-terminal domain-containing protein, partial [Lachnospiraceae bacterium]|nr:chitobiase/beta-hexosaminidase C-terminal domain-containing protein [Lachnospiraceae bacterium]